MREFKFRAWDKKEIYYNPYNDKSSKMIRGVTLDKIRLYVCCDFFDIMQYIGIKDKNEAEIYEGDILDCGDFIGKVEFDPSFCAFVITDGYEIKTFLDVGNEVEVIGNIY